MNNAQIAERGRIVLHLTGVLPDSAEVRAALAGVYEGAHWRTEMSDDEIADAEAGLEG